MTTAPVPRDQVAVLIAAAGSGQRMGLGPKAQLTLGERTLQDWVVRKAHTMADEVIVACAPGAPPPPPDALPWLRLEGGATRQDSVHAMVQASTKPWVVLWDASRPFASVALAQAVLLAAREGNGAAASYWPLDEPVAVMEGTQITRLLSARSGALVQTPLAFSRTLLLSAVERAARERWQCDTTVDLVRRAGHEVSMVKGERHNIKLTVPQDWEMAAALTRWLE